MEKRPTRRRRKTLVKIDNPDDAELTAESIAGDDESLVVLDNPDDGDMYPPGEPAKKD
ncbi:MAG: hypothetical protein H0Z37_11905 [Firmicutes bacterium]|nr:hypothetical protein [Bacillota bacterium]